MLLAQRFHRGGIIADSEGNLTGFIVTLGEGR